MKLERVLYAHTLKVNILNLGILDDLEYLMKLLNGTLFIYDTDEKLLTKVKKFGGLYKLNLDIVKFCYLSAKVSKNSRL